VCMLSFLIQAWSIFWATKNITNHLLEILHETIFISLRWISQVKHNTWSLTKSLGE
jgi:hypothetical protein